MGVIYKITNKVNGKVYIGQSSFSVEKRFAEHCRDMNKRNLEKRPLYSAMKKYGIENFFVELIEECELDIINKREQYWIEFYNSYHNGYNATIGGEGTVLFDHEAIANRLKELPYRAEVAEEFGCSVDLVSNIAHENNIVLKSRSQEALKNKAKTINQYDKNQNFIQNFSSTAEAAEWCYNNNYCKTLNSGVRSHISDCANGKRKSAYGFLWRYN